MNHPAFAEIQIRNHIKYCSLFKKEIWEKINGYDEAMKDGYGDLNFWTRAAKDGFTVTVVNEPLFLCRHRFVIQASMPQDINKQAKFYGSKKNDLVK